MKRKQTFALVASAMLAVLAGLSACSKIDDPVMPEDDTEEMVSIAEPHTLANAKEGDVVDTDGNAYTVDEAHILPWSVTAAGMVAYKKWGDGLVIALNDEASQMNWSYAYNYGAPRHTPAVTGKNWKLPTMNQWKTMFLKTDIDLNSKTVDYESYTELNKALTNVGGTALRIDTDNTYWTATPKVPYSYNSNDGDAYMMIPNNYTNSNVKFANVKFNLFWKYEDGLVRACFAFRY